MRHMIPDKGGDEVVGVIVARLHPHVGGNAGDSARFHEAARKTQRFEMHPRKSITGSLRPSVPPLVRR